MRAQFELTAECPHCNVEGVVVEVYDPAEPSCALGVAAEARCRLCDAAWVGRVLDGPASDGVRDRGTGRCPGCGHALDDDEVEVHACAVCGASAYKELACDPADLRDREALVRCLRRFAVEEGETDLASFVASNFMGRTLDEVHARLARGERVETGFDVMFALFHGGGGGSSGSGAHRSAAPKRHSAPPPRESRPAHDPRAMVLALVSVLVADGTADPRETAFLDRFLKTEGMAPLRPDELRVHRPMEVISRIAPESRARVVELMTQLACIDGTADPSEMRLIESYATAWGIDDEDVARWVDTYRRQYATDLQRFLRRVKAFFVAPRTHDA